MTDFSKLPRDLIEKVLKFYDEFQIQSAIQRTAEFRALYSPIWNNVLSDVRTNTPAYRVSTVNYMGLHVNLFLRLPDCDISNFDMRAMFNSWDYTIRRSALGLPRSLFYLQQ